MRKFNHFVRLLFSIDKRSPTRIGLIGDVHCEDQALETAIEFLLAQQAEILACVGDLADGNGDLNRCCEILRQHNVMTVSGNHDRWLLSEQARSLPDATVLQTTSIEVQKFLQSLPSTIDISTNFGLVQLCHGLGGNDMSSIGSDDFGYALECNEELQNYLRRDKYQLVICGHTHRRMVRRFGDVVIVNVGTLKQDHDPCCGLLDLVEQQVLFYDFDGEKKIIETPSLSVSL